MVIISVGVHSYLECGMAPNGYDLISTNRFILTRGHR